MTLTVLSVSHLSKRYVRQLRRALWYGVRDIARELLPGAAPDGLRDGEFWALDDVSFELGRGESLAIIGDNGAGKSTLLKILYGILKPDRGEVRLRGRAEALIELGTGFNPLLTGRENVLVGAALHGLVGRAANELLDDVSEFAELGEFLDAPLQSYSSGMKARLSYALAASLQPEVLLVDEVLAVGDLAFQRKCATHMRTYLARGGSLLLVSHNTFQVQSLCTRAILLEHGRVAFHGPAPDTVSAMFERRLSTGRSLPARAAAVPFGPMVIDDVRIEPIESDAITTGEPLRITIHYRAETALDMAWGFTIWTADQWVCVAGEQQSHGRRIPAGEGSQSCVIPRLPLVGGNYALRVNMADAETRNPLALYGWHDAPAALAVRSPAAHLANAQVALNQLVRVDVDWS